MYNRISNTAQLSDLVIDFCSAEEIKVTRKIVWMTFTRPSLNLDIWSARLQSLETRTSKLVEDYDSIMNRVEILEHKTVCQTGMVSLFALL